MNKNNNKIVFLFTWIVQHISVDCSLIPFCWFFYIFEITGVRSGSGCRGEKIKKTFLIRLNNLFFLPQHRSKKRRPRKTVMDRWIYTEITVYPYRYPPKITGQQHCWEACLLKELQQLALPPPPGLLPDTESRPQLHRTSRLTSLTHHHCQLSRSLRW